MNLSTTETLSSDHEDSSVDTWFANGSTDEWTDESDVEVRLHHPSSIHSYLSPILRRNLFTIWLDQVPEGWQAPTELPEQLRVLAYQKEICPTTQRLHLQLYASAKQPMKLPAWLQCLNGLPAAAAHLEECKGDEASNLAYVSKEDSRAPGETPVTLGAKQQQGKRSDLASAIATMREGGIKRVAEEHPTTFARTHRGLIALHNETMDTQRDRSTAPTVIVLFGPTGTGKTRAAYEEAEATGKPFYNKMSDNKWWDGYRGEEVCIVDEYYDQFELPYLLKLIDRYPMRVEYKGGSCQMRVTHWIFTSNYDPKSHWYVSAAEVSRQALFRRITRISEML